MVKKAILFFTVLFMIFGCEPTVYEGAEKVENPTKSRSGFFNTDVTLGNDVVSVFNQYGESVSGFVLSEEGIKSLTPTERRRKSSSTKPRRCFGLSTAGIRLTCMKAEHLMTAFLGPL